MVFEAALLFILHIVSSDEKDLAGIFPVSPGVVTRIYLIHGLLDALVVFEFEEIDIVGCQYLQIAASFIRISFWNGICTR